MSGLAYFGRQPSKIFLNKLFGVIWHGYQRLRLLPTVDMEEPEQMKFILRVEIKRLFTIIHGDLNYAYIS